VRRIQIVLGLAGLAVLLGIPAAKGAVTVGMVAPGTPDAVCDNPSGSDVIQESNTVDYEIPPGIASTVITSWTTNAAAGSGQQLALKVFEVVNRSMGIFRQVSHDGPRALTGGALNTFRTELPVKPGDYIGVGRPPGSTPNACIFSMALGNWSHIGYFNDGGQAQFAFGTGYANVSAMIEPSNRFTVDRIRRNRKKGTAQISVTVPAAGSLTLSGRGVRAQQASQDGIASKTVAGPGTVMLRVRSKGRKRQRLNRNGKVRVKVSITYTPTGGTAATQSRKLKLRKP